MTAKNKKADTGDGPDTECSTSTYHTYNHWNRM